MLASLLKVSYCDRPMSGARRRRRASVNNSFKHFLLPNRKANLGETLQGCSLAETLQKLFKEFHSLYNSSCQKKAKALKIFFSETRRRKVLIFGV